VVKACFVAINLGHGAFELDNDFGRAAGRDLFTKIDAQRRPLIVSDVNSCVSSAPVRTSTMSSCGSSICVCAEELLLFDDPL
jgi:hypothetical protein